MRGPRGTDVTATSRSYRPTPSTAAAGAITARPSPVALPVSAKRRNDSTGFSTTCQETAATQSTTPIVTAVSMTTPGIVPTKKDGARKIESWMNGTW